MYSIQSTGKLCIAHYCCHETSIAAWYVWAALTPLCMLRFLQTLKTVLDKLLPMYLGLSSFNPLSVLSQLGRVGITDWHNVHYRCSRFLFRFTKAAFVLLVSFSIISALLQRHARHHTRSHTLATRPEHQYSLCKSAASGDVATGTSLSIYAPNSTKFSTYMLFIVQISKI